MVRVHSSLMSFAVTRHDVLLWTRGNAGGAIGKNYYQERKGIPLPLELVRFGGHGGWEEHLRAVLGPTTMVDPAFGVLDAALLEKRAQ